MKLSAACKSSHTCNQIGCISPQFNVQYTLFTGFSQQFSHLLLRHLPDAIIQGDFHVEGRIRPLGPEARGLPTPYSLFQLLPKTPPITNRLATHPETASLIMLYGCQTVALPGIELWSPEDIAQI